MKATGMSSADLGKKLATMRTVVGTEVLRFRAGIMTPGVMKEGDVRVIERIKVKPGMGDKYPRWPRTMLQPVNEARIAAGELKGWSVWARVFPSGVATSYDALAVSYLKDLASAIKGLDATKGVQTFLKVQPDKTTARSSTTHATTAICSSGSSCRSSRWSSARSSAQDRFRNLRTAASSRRKNGLRNRLFRSRRVGVAASSSFATSDSGGADQFGTQRLENPTV